MSMFNCRLCGRRIDSDFEDAVEDPKDCCEMVCMGCLDEDEEDQEYPALVAERDALLREREILWNALTDAFSALRYIETHHRKASKEEV